MSKLNNLTGCRGVCFVRAPNQRRRRRCQAEEILFSIISTRRESHIPSASQIQVTVPPLQFLLSSILLRARIHARKEDATYDAMYCLIPAAHHFSFRGSFCSAGVRGLLPCHVCPAGSCRRSLAVSSRPGHRRQGPQAQGEANVFGRVALCAYSS
jgi:hypothetical protein